MKIYLVGGAVRDILLGKIPKDLDYVVVGATEKEMTQKGFKKVGHFFPVFIHPETRFEYALARKETKAGKGHKGFHFKFSPDVTLKEDLVRRDLSINAMAMDEETKEIFDYHDGQKDLKNKILRHVSPHFSEDPLRVLRVARFHSQLPDFTVEKETIELLQKMGRSHELKTLSSERILEEFTKALLGQNPLLFFETLDSSLALDELFPLIKTLKHRRKNPSNINDWEYAFAILQLAKVYDLPLDHLVSCFFLIFGKSSSPPQQKQDIEDLDTFLKNLRFPQKARALCLATAEHHQWGHDIFDLTPPQILDLLKQLKAFHKEASLLPDFLKCLEMDHKMIHGKDSSSKSSAWLLSLLKQLRSLDLKSLEQKFQGKELGEAIDKARQEIILSWPKD
jgi:tRNA nucleotidyltransferase (CCA-adding enzyme)